MDNSSSSADKLRIALYTYSTQPRGGVVHTLSLAESLQALGHYVHIYALGKDQQSSFFRPTSAPYTLIPCHDHGKDEPMDERIQRYIDTYFEYLAANRPRQFDIHHAQDCVSGNSLWRLKEEGLIPSFVRTVHHVDDFTSPALIACQDRAIYRPDVRIVVSRYWQQRLRGEFNMESQVIHNGVDVARFRPPSAEERREARAQFGIEDQHVLLNIGGIDPRKNSIVLLRAFQAMRRQLLEKGRQSILLCAGGATLLDYRPYRDQFMEEFAASGLKMNEDLFLLGVVPEEQVRLLYWAADTLAFPSTKEGWGLVVLEALGTGLPVLASNIPVFREYLRNEQNALLVDPTDEAGMAEGLTRLATDGVLKQSLAAAGPVTAAGFSWTATAQAHVESYRAALAGGLGRDRASL